MTFRGHHGQGALLLAAGIALTGIGLAPAGAQTPPSPAPSYSPWQSIVPPGEADTPGAEVPEADGKDAEADGSKTGDSETRDASIKDASIKDASIRDASVKDGSVKDLELDWSQLNVDASTLGTSPKSKARVAPQTGSSTEMSWTSNDKGNGSSAVTVKQSLSDFLDTRVGADMTVTRQPQTLTEVRDPGQWRQPAAILRHGVGRDHRARRRLDLGQDRGGSPARPVAGAEQARHVAQQVASAQRAIFALLSERL